MTLEEIERKLEDIAYDFDYANILLTEADGLTICPVKYREAMDVFKSEIRTLNALRDEIRVANWAENFNTL